MENTLLIISIIAILVIGYVLFFKRGKSSADIKIGHSNSKEIINREVMSTDIIKVETLSVEALPDDIEFNEIKDSNVISHITSLIPGLAQVLNNVNNILHLSKSNVYQAILPNGETLAK